MTRQPDSWRNWAGDQACSPAETVRPAGEREVAEAVVRAGRYGWTVRVAGSGHSFADAVLTDGMLLSLERMNRVLEVDPASGRVRVEAGITLRELNEVLDAHGLALPNLGDIDAQSIAGATATGTHGTGAGLQNLSAGVQEVELILADGSRFVAGEESDADALRAARVSLGALGVVTAVTLRTVPAFTLQGIDARRALQEVWDNLDELVSSNDHFEFYSFPHSGLALTRTNNRVEGGPRPRSRAKAWANDILLTNHAFGLICRTGRRFPSLIPLLNRFTSWAAGNSARVDLSHRIFASPRLVRFTEMEYALPRSHARDAVLAVRDCIERNGFHVPFPLEVRFVASDDAWLSPSYGRATCYVAVHMFEGMEWEPYFRAVEQIMDGFDGRPHWGKRHFQNAQTLRPRYPEWERFAAVRARLDPEGRFANAYVRRVLGDDAAERNTVENTHMGRGETT
ncbi:MAG: D-arabinono-1,4-lactone oxidase [Actinomycetota bacterium]